jgi:phosphoenolpyruvate carboxykinase (ATP)
MSTLLELVNHPKVFKNPHRSLLMEKTLQKQEGSLGPEGELVILTGLHTGRAANDKYVVLNDLTKNKIWWENNINKMSEEVFHELRVDVVNYLKSESELFFTERSIGSSNNFSLGIEFISTQASAAFFTQYMFKPFEGEAHNDDYKILHAPNFKLDPKKYGTRSETVIVTCFKEKTTIIVGTLYAGEIKKSMFSVMNFLLPDEGILPMHSGANQNSTKESFVFFGLSGTGKTTLSTDEGLQLIGDDEHGLSEKGIFNFEGGCYAKTYKLSPETEPSIYQASNQYSSFLENVKLSDDRSSIDFFDDGLTENGRSSYPLSFITNRVESGEGSIPKNIFYLSADAFGVLPPVSLLNAKQAMDYFKLGYSAKLAGTEVGVKTPSATFSSCFGAPFMLRHPDVYSNLLNEFITKYKIKVWLINTGWFGGSYGKGSRFPLKITRNIIRQIQADKLNNSEFVTDEIFNLKIPVAIDLVDSSILVPRNAWADQAEYLQVAQNLAASFEAQLIKIKN